jgi:hypothetical protein
MESGSNPPALVKLKDGRLCCIYGDHHHRRIAGIYSEDGGKTWGMEFIIREDFEELDEDPDLGYPKMLQRRYGKLVALYFWTTSKIPQQHIAVSIWEPSD